MLSLESMEEATIHPHTAALKPINPSSEPLEVYAARRLSYIRAYLVWHARSLKIWCGKFFHIRFNLQGIHLQWQCKSGAHHIPAIAQGIVNCSWGKDLELSTTILVCWDPDLQICPWKLFVRHCKNYLLYILQRRYQKAIMLLCFNLHNGRSGKRAENFRQIVGHEARWDLSMWCSDLAISRNWLSHC